MSDDKPNAAPALKSAPKPAAMAGSHYFAAILAVVALLVAVVPWAVPAVTARLPAAALWQVPTTDAAPKLAQLQQEVAALRTALQTQPAPPDMALYDVRLSKIEEKLAAVEAGLLAADVSISAVAAAPAAPVMALDDKKITLLRIENKFTRGVAFAADLPALQDKIAAENYQALAAAAVGVPTARALAMRLNQQSRTLEAAYAEAEATDWWGRVKASLSGLVQIKKADEAAGTPLAQLAAIVEAEDYVKAAEIFATLPEVVRRDLAPWWAQVQTRAAATAALQVLFK